MKELNRVRHKEITYLFRNNYANVYAKLTQILNEEEWSLFAKIRQTGNESIWVVEGSTEYRSFGSASEEEKDIAAEFIRMHKADILTKIRKDSELASIGETLFAIPNEDKIFIGKDEFGGVRVVLSQWGCNENRGDRSKNPLGKVLERPGSKHSIVVTLVRYSDGSLPVDKTFFFHYKDVLKPFNLSDEGKRRFGILPHGAQFGISDSADSLENLRTFHVEEGLNLYTAEFPVYASVKIKVINQLGEPVSHCSIETDSSNGTSTADTDEQGEIFIDRIKINETPLSVQLTENTDIHASFPLKKGNNELVFKIEEQIQRTPIVKVLDKEGEIVQDYPIEIITADDRHSYLSDYEGLVQLGAVDLGKELEIIDGYDKYNNLKFVVSADAYECIMVVELPEPQLVTVSLIDHRKRPIPGISLDILANNDTIYKITDENGNCILPYESFAPDEKVKVKIHVPNGTKKKKVVKKSFTFQPDQLAYVLKLRKINWLWLLVLLPLLLLIKCEKEIYVKTIHAENKQLLENSTVAFFHQEHFLYDAGRFFTNDTLANFYNTNAQGVATISGLRYSVYSFISKRSALALASATNGCFVSDTLLNSYHEIWDQDTLTLSLTPILMSMDFRVVDKSDGEPLPDAWVRIESEFAGSNYIDSSKSDANGRVVFDRIPRCGTLDYSIGSLEGYYPDSIANRSIPDLIGNLDDQRLLELTPITENLVFHVVDCNTNRGIPGALVTVDIEGRKTVKKRTNVNGIGKGSYEDVHIISEVGLSAEKRGYRKGTLPRKYQVGEFIDLPKKDRTICLEPIPNPLVFETRDSLTNKALLGAKNVVRIENGGKVVSTDTMISDAKGQFMIETRPGDKVSVISSYPPDYKDNKTKIENVDQEKLKNGPPDGRIIPLAPKMVELFFRTVEDDNPSQTIPGVDLGIRVNYKGNNVSLHGVPQRSNSNGEFRLKVPESASLSIVASKNGYEPNNTKVNNKAVKLLLSPPGRQADRDIPLKKAPPPCNERVQAGADGITIDEYNMLDKNLVFQVAYNMNTEPDQIIIYCGRQNSPGTILGQTLGKVSGYGTIPIDLSRCGTTSWITVKIIGGRGTQWDYQIVCPN